MQAPDAVPVTEGMPGPKASGSCIGALRILTRFDRLSMMAKKLKVRRLEAQARARCLEAEEEGHHRRQGVTWEFLGLVC